MDESRMKHCRNCGKLFHASQQRRFYCSKECFDTRHVVRVKRNAVAKGIGVNKNLEDVLCELDTYNKEHGAQISYGQWMAGIRAV